MRRCPCVLGEKTQTDKGLWGKSRITIRILSLVTEEAEEVGHVLPLASEATLTIWELHGPEKEFLCNVRARCEEGRSGGPFGGG